MHEYSLLLISAIIITSQTTRVIITLIRLDWQTNMTLMELLMGRVTQGALDPYYLRFGFKVYGKFTRNLINQQIKIPKILIAVSAPGIIPFGTLKSVS